MTQQDALSISAQRTAEIIRTYGQNEKDTGSTAVQVALLSDRITNLSRHLGENKKDKHGQRGLQLLNGQRRRLLKYMERTDYDAYIALTDKLGIRRGQKVIR